MHGRVDLLTPSTLLCFGTLEVQNALEWLSAVVSTALGRVSRIEMGARKMKRNLEFSVWYGFISAVQVAEVARCCVTVCWRLDSE